MRESDEFDSDAEFDAEVDAEVDSEFDSDDESDTDSEDESDDESEDESESIELVSRNNKATIGIWSEGICTCGQPGMSFSSNHFSGTPANTDMARMVSFEEKI